MRIASFHIDSFGIFSDAGADALSPGLSVFLGANESGKTTCLEFLRAMLFGFPQEKAYPLLGAGSGGERIGGSLVLKIPGAREEEIRLSRFAAKGGDALILQTPGGDAVPQEELERLFGGVGADLYRSVYGFSLAELEKFAGLNADGVRRALYGASFGPGVNPPGEALKALGGARQAIFAPDDADSSLHKMLDELGDLESSMAALGEKIGSYDALALELAEVRRALDETRGRRENLEAERRRLERRLNAWRIYGEWRLAELGLEAMPFRAAPDFPADGAERLRDIRREVMRLEGQAAEYGEKIAAVEERKNALQINLPLVEALPALRRLAERKSAYREALSRIPRDEEAKRRDAKELAESLARLGPGWDCRRIRETNRSLFAREDLEKLARETAAASSAHQACIDALARANREVENLKREIAAAKETLSNLPTPDAVLNGSERDALRQDMARLEECERSAPLRRQALENAREAFARTFERLRFSPGARAGANDSAAAGAAQDASGKERALLDALMSRQDEAFELAARLQGDIRASEALERELAQAARTAEETRKKIEDLRERLRKEAGPGREALDARAQALRSLRSLAANIATEKERLRELDGRISGQKKPLAGKSAPLLIFGALLFALGAAVLLARWLLGISEYPVTSSLSVPVNLWSGYLTLACGVAFLAGGLPRSGPEARQFATEMAQLQNRRESCALHLAELGEQAQAICEQAGFADADPITLDAVEMLLEREREQCYQEERAAQELDDLQKLFESQEARADALAKEHQAKEQEAQQGRRLWHALMQTLHLATVPSPESAESFFARAENARIALNAVENARAEAESGAAEKTELERRVSTLPPVAEIMRDSGASLVEAVALVLESCHEADTFREQRMRCEADLQSRESSLARAENLQREAAAELAVAAERLERGRAEWNRGIAGLGLGEDLNPETVREAFKCMEHCLRVESRLEEREADLARKLAELEGFEKPLDALARRFGIGCSRDEQGREDWQLTLDALLEEAESMDAALKTASRLDIQLGRDKGDLRAIEARLVSERARLASLLREADACDEEEFLALAAAKEKEEALAAKSRGLRDQLKLAAGREEEETFISSLADFADGEIEDRLEEGARRLGELAEAQIDLERRASGLDAEVSALRQSDELADLRRRRELLLEKMRRAVRDWSVNALAAAIITEAGTVYEREKQPALIARASEIFASMAGGWRGLAVSLEDATLQALPQSGAPVAPEVLSRGTQEQIQLALHLAYIMEQARDAQSLPVIMDDILVNFDPERTRKAARAFGRMALDGQQIIYFTCRPETARLLAEAAPGATRYALENGKILAQNA